MNLNLDQPPIRPTPEEVDALAQEHLAAKTAENDAAAACELIERRAVELVQEFGVVPADAQKSRRLNGNLAQLTITSSNIRTVNDARVEDLKAILVANDRGEFLEKLFQLHSKYGVVDGAEAALIAAPLPKRLAAKVMSLWVRCISVKAKKPSLKVVIAE